MTEGGYVKTNELQDGIVEIEFFHPKHNSLPSDLLKQLEGHIRLAGSHPSVKVIILKSGGDRTFCAGANFEELINIDDEASGLHFFSGFANVINACRKCPKMIIGRVQGKAVGGGVGLASAVDYCIASSHSSIRLSELSIAIGPFVIGPAVKRKLGISAYSQMGLSPDKFFTADWAHEKGLFAEVHKNQEELDNAVFAKATLLSGINIEAQSLLKKAWWEDCSHWDSLLIERAKMSGKLVLSEDTKKVLDKYRK